MIRWLMIPCALEKVLFITRVEYLGSRQFETTGKPITWVCDISWGISVDSMIEEELNDAERVRLSDNTVDKEDDDAKETQQNLGVSARKVHHFRISWRVPSFVGIRYIEGFRLTQSQYDKDCTMLFRVRTTTHPPEATVADVYIDAPEQTNSEYELMKISDTNQIPKLYYRFKIAVRPVDRFLI